MDLGIVLSIRMSRLNRITNKENRKQRSFHKHLLSRNQKHLIIVKEIHLYIPEIQPCMSNNFISV